MSTPVEPNPQGYPTLCPSLNFLDTKKAIAFYIEAFGACERFRMPGPGDTIMHAEVQIGDSVLMLSDASEHWHAPAAETLGACPTLLSVRCEDVDAACKQALEAGAEVLMPLENMPWGERCTMLKDPFGYRWTLVQHIEDVTPEEVERRLKEAGMWAQ
jgi:uncharacterized glyoxalase superfamily protein PhnB